MKQSPSALVALLALAAAAPLTAAEADRGCTKAAPAPGRTRAALAALFAAPAEPVASPQGVVAHVPVVEVVVARIGPDGRPVLACVDNPAAAERFLEAGKAGAGAQTKEQ